MAQLVERLPGSHAVVGSLHFQGKVSRCLAGVLFPLAPFLLHLFIQHISTNICSIFTVEL